MTAQARERLSQYITKIKKGTIKGLRFFFIMLILEYAIETFFIFLGAYLGNT